MSELAKHFRSVVVISLNGRAISVCSNDYNNSSYILDYIKKILPFYWVGELILQNDGTIRSVSEITGTDLWTWEEVSCV